MKIINCHRPPESRYLVAGSNAMITWWIHLRFLFIISKK